MANKNPLRQQGIFLRDLRIFDLFVVRIQTFEEIIISAFVEFLKFNNDAGANIQFAGFVFGISGSADITATALQFCADSLLRQAGNASELQQVIAHIPITSDLLFHTLTSVTYIDQYWLQLPIFYVILVINIDRYTGQKTGVGVGNILC